MTKFAPHQALKLIARGRLAFGARTVLLRVVCWWAGEGFPPLIVLISISRRQGFGWVVQGSGFRVGSEVWHRLVRPQDVALDFRRRPAPGAQPNIYSNAGSLHRFRYSQVPHINSGLKIPKFPYYISYAPARRDGKGPKRSLSTLRDHRMSHSTSAAVPLLFHKVDKSELSQMTYHSFPR